MTITLDPPSKAAMAACKQSMIIIMSNGECIPCSRSKKNHVLSPWMVQSTDLNSGVLRAHSDNDTP